VKTRSNATGQGTSGILAKPRRTQCRTHHAVACSSPSAPLANGPFTCHMRRLFGLLCRSASAARLTDPYRSAEYPSLGSRLLAPLPPRSYPSNPPSPLASVRRRPPGSARNGGSSELGLTCSRPGKEALPVSRELIACPFSADSSFIRWVPSDSIFCSWVADTPFRPVYRGFACFLHGQASNSSLFSLKYLVV
jgi:hypothetical protein